MPDDVLPVRHRVHQPHPVVPYEDVELPFDGAEVPGLYLHQEAVLHHVDDVVAYHCLHLVPGFGVPLLQLVVEALLSHSQPYASTLFISRARLNR